MSPGIHVIQFTDNQVFTKGSGTTPRVAVASEDARATYVIRMLLKLVKFDQLQEYVHVAKHPP